MGDLPQRVEIRSSPTKTTGLIVGAIGMTAGSASMAFRVLPGIDAGSFGEFVGYVGLVFFGLCTVLIFWRFLTTRGPVVTMDVQGICDTRIAKKVIPWSAVRDISTWEMSGQKVMVLAVDPAVEAGLNLSRIARWTRQANRSLGADGLCVTAQGIKTTYATLFSTARAFWNRNS